MTDASGVNGGVNGVSGVSGGGSHTAGGTLANAGKNNAGGVSAGGNGANSGRGGAGSNAKGGAPAGGGEANGGAGGRASGAGGGGASAASGAGGGGASGSDGFAHPPFFSEYIEGSGSEKALEIAADAPVDVSGCQIEIYANGASKRSRIIALGALLVDGAIASRESPLVVCSPELAALSSSCALSETLPFTGNDTILLTCAGNVVDAFGRLLEDPGANGWGTPPRRTSDVTLRRSCGITQGDPDPNDAFDPALEWEEAPLDAFDDLGVHCAR
jgi:hypothetical protein